MGGDKGPSESLDAGILFNAALQKVLNVGHGRGEKFETGKSPSRDRKGPHSDLTVGASEDTTAVAT